MVLTAGLFATLPAGSAGAAAKIRITAAYYNQGSACQTSTTNACLNKEYIVIRNSGTRAQQMSGWTLRDAHYTGTPNVYRFPRFKLGPGHSVRIHSGKGSKTKSDLYWGRSDYVWGNDWDKAILKNKARTTISKCSWTAANTSPKYC